MTLSRRSLFFGAAAAATAVILPSTAVPAIVPPPAAVATTLWRVTPQHNGAYPGDPLCQRGLVWSRAADLNAQWERRLAYIDTPLNGGGTNRTWEVVYD